MIGHKQLIEYLCDLFEKSVDSLQFSQTNSAHFIEIIDLLIEKQKRIKYVDIDFHFVREDEVITDILDRIPHFESIKISSMTPSAAFIQNDDRLYVSRPGEIDRGVCRAQPNGVTVTFLGAANLYYSSIQSFFKGNFDLKRK